MQLVFSNRLHVLFEHFSKSYQQHAPFEKHLVLVPSFATEFYMKKKCAEELGICLGLDFAFLQPGIKQILTSLFPAIKLRSQQDLALLLEKEIEFIIKDQEGLSLSEKKCYEPLLKYFEYDKSTEQIKNLAPFSDNLASLFNQYGIYSQSLKEDWQPEIDLNWQQLLWKKIDHHLDFLTYPKQLLTLDPSPLSSPVNMYLFGFSFVPDLYYQLIEKISPYINLHIFQLSPCKLFWTDTRNTFEKRALMERLKRKGKSLNEIDELSGYLSNSNPLLSSLGKLGRSWFQSLEESTLLQIEEEYVCPQPVLSLPAYTEQLSEFETRFVDEEMTLLKHIQMDLLTLRRPEEALSVGLDNSIMIHKSLSYQREVEVLFANVKQEFLNNPNYRLSDVIILVPEIEKYIPYIESLFGEESSPFEYVIHDYPFKAKNSLLQGFQYIMELHESRWEPKALFKLFEHSLFQKRFKLSQEQVATWKRWVEELNVQWGLDEGHQLKLLSQSYGEDKMSFFRHKSSWTDFFKRVVEVLTNENNTSFLTRSLNRMSLSDIPSLNIFLELVSSLISDFEPLTDPTKTTFQNWASYLISLLKSYFEKEHEESSDMLSLTNRIEQLSKLSPTLISETFPFSTFWYYLRKDLSVFHTEVYSHQLEALSFYSLYSKPFREAKVVYVLGLNEETFPRNPLKDSLSLLDGFTSNSFCPQVIDLDRYQFLELILLAQDTLSLSFLSCCQKTHKEQLPSLLITELLSYLDRNYKIENKKPSSCLMNEHSALSFDAINFQRENEHHEAFKLARSYYQQPKKKPLSQLTMLLNKIKPVEFNKGYLEAVEKLSIQKLSAFVRNPMKYHLNQEYQIYLDDELFENRDQNYVLTNFQKALLKKEFFKTNQIPLDNTVMPKGVFGDALNDYLNEEREKNHQFLMNLGIKRSDIFQIELRDDINKVEQIGSSSWLAPSLTLSLAPGHTVHIVGLLENITEQGFLVLNRHSLDNIWCLWPSLLAATIVNSTLNKPFSPALHFLSSSKSIYYNIEKPIEELQSFVSFYSIYSKNFCPILPEWLSTMANDPVEKIQSKIKADLQSEHFYNSYAKSIFNSRELPEKNELEMWSIWLKKQFSQSLNSMGLFK